MEQMLLAQTYWPKVIILLVIAQRVIELWVSRRNSNWMRSQGAKEHGLAITWALILVNCIFLFTLMGLVRSTTTIHWEWVYAYLAIQVLRYWTLATLGRYWCIRVLTLDSFPLIKRGPYRFMSHPNYLVLTGEVITLPLAFDLPGMLWIALGFALVQGILLVLRIRVEEAAIAPRRQLAA